MAESKQSIWSIMANPNKENIVDIGITWSFNVSVNSYYYIYMTLAHSGCFPAKQCLNILTQGLMGCKSDFFQGKLNGNQMPEI